MKTTATTPAADRPTSRRKPATPAAEPGAEPGAVTRRRKSGVQFFYDEKGRKSHVVLDIKLYHQLLDDLEMAEDLQAYWEAKARNEPTISLEELQKELAEGRKQNQPNGVSNG